MQERLPTRAEWVDRLLRDAIITGEFLPGQKLLSEQLAQRWSVSATPVREAYQRLAAEGLVELLPQRGARVAPVSLDESRDIYMLRHLLEPRALRRSVERRDDAWEREIAETFELLEKQLRAGATDLVAFEDAHRAFHRALISRCGSPWMLRIIELLQDHSVRYRLLSIEPRGGTDEVLKEHAALLDACQRGDVETATSHLTHHLALTLESLEDVDAFAAGAAERREENP